jgi:hypothetical protein
VTPPQDRYLATGTKVWHDAVVSGGSKTESEVGIVVHCWMNEEMGGYDCYVAFFGSALPVGVPAEKPYILRYASSSLRALE